MPDPSTPPPLDPPIPTQTGLGLAALILGALCVPLAAYLGVHSLAVSLPVFGIWFFLPVVVLAIALGMLSSQHHRGVAGAALGVAALLVCLSFVAVDRMYGPGIRQQLAPSPAAQPGLRMEDILKLTGPPPATQPH